MNTNEIHTCHQACVNIRRLEQALAVAEEILCFIYDGSFDPLCLNLHQKITLYKLRSKEALEKIKAIKEGWE